MSTAPLDQTADQVNDGLHKIHKLAQGVIRAEIVTPEEGKRLMAAGLLGDRGAQLRLLAIADCGRGVLRHKDDEPKLCLACSDPITSLRGRTFVLLFPARDDAAICATGSLCDHCAGADPEKTKSLIAEGLKKLYWPDLRLIEISNETGHA